MKRKSYQRYEQASSLSPWERKVYDDLKDAAQVERTQPAGAKSWTPHLAMAGSLALCLSLAVFVAVLVIALRRRLPPEIAFNDAGFGAGLTFAVALVIGILVAVTDFRGGLASVERILDRDLDGNGQVGADPLRAIIVRGAARATSRQEADELGEPPDQLERFGHFCLECLRTGTIARREATGWRLIPYGAHDSPKVSRTEWETWRGWFEAAGLLDDQGGLRAGLTWADIEGAFPDLGGQVPGGQERSTEKIGTG